MIKYINTRIGNEVETIDEINSEDFIAFKAYRLECRRLLAEYEMAFNAPCYLSQRSTKEWSKQYENLKESIRG